MAGHGRTRPEHLRCISCNLFQPHRDSAEQKAFCSAPYKPCVCLFSEVGVFQQNFNIFSDRYKGGIQKTFFFRTFAFPDINFLGLSVSAP